MKRVRVKGGKYSRVSQQQKFIFLHLVIKENYSISQAASKAKIHYSTAKTILFFHKNKLRNYFLNRIQKDSESSQKVSKIRASYRFYSEDELFQMNRPQKIQIISKIVNRAHPQRKCVLPKPGEIENDERITVKVQDAQVDIKFDEQIERYSNKISRELITNKQQSRQKLAQRIMNEFNLQEKPDKIQISKEQMI